MADTTFTSGTVIASSWLNDVNRKTYREEIALGDYGVLYDGSDETARVQDAVDYCLSFNPPKALRADGMVKLGSSVYIDRPVDGNDNEFEIIGNGGGFYTTGNVVMFDSTLPLGSGVNPSSEFITFTGVRFATSSVFNTSYVMSEKFLRIKFHNCFFWIIRCLAASTYAQTWFFHHCNIRNNPGRFFDCAGSYDIGFMQCIVENGSTLFRSIDATRGTNGLRIIGGVIEGLQAKAVIATGATAIICGVHIESNAADDFDFSTGSITNPAITVIGNYNFNPNGPMVKLGTTTTLWSSGNNVSGQLFNGLANVTNMVSFDTAGTLGDVSVNSRIGNMRFKGPVVSDIVALTYSASISVFSPTTTAYTITPTNSTAFTVTSGGAIASGQELEITVINTTGGALGTLTWDTAAFKTSTWTQPATGFRKTIRFRYNGLFWSEVSVSASIPN